jgi:CHRD domain-containing protein
MRNRLIFSVIVGLLSLFVGATVAVAGEGGSDNAIACALNTQLSPANEVRPVGTTDPVTSVASGHAQIKVRNDGTIEFKVFVLNPANENFLVGHIHGQAPAGQNAGVLVDLLGGGAGGSAFTETTMTLMGEGAPTLAAPADIAVRLCMSPELYYVNFHTSADPQGAIRGQLG